MFFYRVEKKDDLEGISKTGYIAREGITHDDISYYVGFANNYAGNTIVKPENIEIFIDGQWLPLPSIIKNV